MLWYLSIVSNSSFTPLASKSADSDIANKFVRPRPATIPRDGSLSFNDGEQIFLTFVHI